RRVRGAVVVAVHGRGTDVDRAVLGVGGDIAAVRGVGVVPGRRLVVPGDPLPGRGVEVGFLGHVARGVGVDVLVRVPVTVGVHVCGDRAVRIVHPDGVVDPIVVEVHVLGRGVAVTVDGDLHFPVVRGGVRRVSRAAIVD